jgi:hypothetical protein
MAYSHFHGKHPGTRRGSDEGKQVTRDDLGAQGATTDHAPNAARCGHMCREHEKAGKEFHASSPGAAMVIKAEPGTMAASAKRLRPLPESARGRASRAGLSGGPGNWTLPEGKPESHLTRPRAPRTAVAWGYPQHADLYREKAGL